MIKVAHAPSASRPRPRPSVTPLLRALLLFPIVRLLCAPRRIIGREHIPAGPVIFVANHASHADTLLILRALPREQRDRVAPAAAEDYFFAGPVTAAFTRAVIGGFPFPRRGRAGLDRAHALLRRGRSVLLFPEGTRTTDGRIAAFKSGAARLAAQSGVVVVPIGLAGTRDVLPKGGRLPRRRPVAVAFGAPLHDPGSGRVEAAVKRAAAAAESARAPRRTWHTRVRAFARSRAGLALAFAWGVAEALAWPIVPDLAVAVLVLAAPRRVVPVAGAALAGSVAGGMIAYTLGALGAAGVLDHLPLVTGRMQAEAAQRMAGRGAAGVLSQPWSGIPFKVFAYQAHDTGTGPASFALAGAVARGARLLQVGLSFAAGAFLLRRWLDRLYPVLVGATTIAFFYGLGRVVAAWA